MIAEAVAFVRSLWSNLFRRGRVEEDLDDELRAYVDLLSAEYERSGMSRAEARRAALVTTGGVEQVKESARDAWVGNAIASYRREIAYAFRTLRRSPTFAVIAVATLALGIGGATAVFTVVKGSLLRPLPGVRDPGQLVTVERVMPTELVPEFSYADFVDLKARSTTLTGLAGYNGTSMALENASGSERAWVSYVTDDFFTVLGVRPALGRVFTAADARADLPERGQVAVLGHDIWQRRFGGDPRVVGSTFKLKGHVYTVIGVAPPGFVGGMARYPMELFIPFASGNRAAGPLSGTDLSSRRDGILRVIGRLAPGKRVEDVERELSATAARMAEQYATMKWRTVKVLPGAGMVSYDRDELSRIPRLLGMAVAMLLLIACANVASLSLVRAAARRRELATRLALGASHAALVRQVALEGTVLAVGAGFFGILFARVLVRSAALVHSVIPLDDIDLRTDPRVLAVAFAAAALTAVLVSLAPALQVSRVPPGAVLKEGGRGIARRSGQRLLVGVQVGASLVLLASATIVFGSFQRVLLGHESVDPKGLSFGVLDVGALMPDTTRQLAFLQSVLDGVSSNPEIAGAAITSGIPPMPWANHATVYRRGEEPAPNGPARENDSGARVEEYPVSGSFFDVMKIAIVRGRKFSAVDGPSSQRVVIVSRRLADQLWSGKEPVGELLSWPEGSKSTYRPLLVVGVAADTRDVTLSPVAPLAIYVPFTQHADANSRTLLVRGRGGTFPARRIRGLVEQVAPGVAVSAPRTLDDALRAQLEPQRIASTWIGAFGVLALLLASIGLYGVVAQGVVQRTRELAVRAALGSTPGGIVALVLGDGARVAALGALVGVLGAVGAVRVLGALFAGVGSVDLRNAPASVGLLALALFAATFLPARRAARLNPVDALRAD
jgi:predicted permease